MIDIPIRVKDALKAGSYRKNWRMIVLPNTEDPEGFVIENNSIVKESVMIDERMCSGKQLKFGLCEGSSLEFQYFDHPNIQGRRIEAILEAEYEDADKILKWYQIPMGFFDVDACPMQFSTGIRKVTAYNKLKSEYLDADMTDQVKQIIAQGDGSLGDGVYIRSITDSLLGNYAITKPDEREEAPFIRYHIPEEADDIVDHFRCKEHIDDPSIKYMIDVVMATFFLDPRYVHDHDNFYMYYAGQGLLDYINEIKKDVIDENYYYATTSSQYSGYMTWEEIERNTFPLVLYQDSFFGIRIETFFNNKEESTLSPDIPNAIKDSMKKGGASYYAYESDYFTEMETMRIHFPVLMIKNDYPWSRNRITKEHMIKINENVEKFADALISSFDLMKKTMSENEKIKITSDKLKNDFSVTPRDIQGAVYEMDCEFGKLNRATDYFSGKALNNKRLLPSESLYPKENRYPESDSEQISLTACEKIWTDSAQANKFKNLIITFRAKENGQDVEKKLQRQINADGNVNYNMSDNWLFKNLEWTADQVGSIADGLAEKLRDVSWIPFEIWSAGMPWLETGDEIEISNKEGTFTSYILSRQLKGIQDLHDTYINGELEIF